MALNPADRAQASRIAQHIYAAMRAEQVRAGFPNKIPTEGAIARQLQRMHLGLAGENYQAYAGVARRVIQQAAAAASTNRRTVNPVPAAQLPVDDVLVNYPEEFRYVVLITSDHDAKTERGIVTEVRSNVPLNRAQIEAELVNRTDWSEYARGDRRHAVMDNRDASPITVTVLSAGRR